MDTVANFFKAALFLKRMRDQVKHNKTRCARVFDTQHQLGELVNRETRHLESLDPVQVDAIAGLVKWLDQAKTVIEKHGCPSFFKRLVSVSSAQQDFAELYQQHSARMHQFTASFSGSSLSAVRGPAVPAAVQPVAVSQVEQLDDEQTDLQEDMKLAGQVEALAASPAAAAAAASTPGGAELHEELLGIGGTLEAARAARKLVSDAYNASVRNSGMVMTADEKKGERTRATGSVCVSACDSVCVCVGVCVCVRARVHSPHSRPR